jgi:hypothetical protein
MSIDAGPSAESAPRTRKSLRPLVEAERAVALAAVDCSA